MTIDEFFVHYDSLPKEFVKYVETSPKDYIRILHKNLSLCPILAVFKYLNPEYKFPDNYLSFIHYGAMIELSIEDCLLIARSSDCAYNLDKLIRQRLLNFVG